MNEAENERNSTRIGPRNGLGTAGQAVAVGSTSPKDFWRASEQVAVEKARPRQTSRESYPRRNGAHLPRGPVTYLYIFGKIGGPFKVGYSHQPEARAKSIMHWSPGRQYSAGLAIMWDTFPLPDRATAKIAERAAHRKLRRYQLLLRDGGEGWRSEWFNAPLPLIRRAVARIAARHNGTSFRLDMSEKAFGDAGQKWRSKQPDHADRHDVRLPLIGLSWPRWKGMPCSRINARKPEPLGRRPVRPGLAARVSLGEVVVVGCGRRGTRQPDGLDWRALYRRRMTILIRMDRTATIHGKRLRCPTISCAPTVRRSDQPGRRFRFTPPPEQFHLTRAHACPLSGTSASARYRPAPSSRNPARHGPVRTLRRPLPDTGAATPRPDHRARAATPLRVRTVRVRDNLQRPVRSVSQFDAVQNPPLCKTNKSGRFSFQSDTNAASSAWAPRSVAVAATFGPIARRLASTTDGGREQQHVQGLRHRGLYVVFSGTTGARRRNGRPLMSPRDRAARRTSARSWLRFREFPGNGFIFWVGDRETRHQFRVVEFPLPLPSHASHDAGHRLGDRDEVREKPRRR